MRKYQKPAPIVNTFTENGVKTTAVRRYSHEKQMARWDCSHTLLPDEHFTMSCSVLDNASEYKQIDMVDQHLEAVKKDLLNYEESLNGDRKQS